ncbi:MAG: hypothetical protein HOE48_23770 [Candidatus Latescibacteria bacterium]|nr:hypothetical protein [Candidatus Latescibacterota bacterium]MBT4140947.1 hypothetical protein [Candidatus Latescibacterota bacterium]
MGFQEGVALYWGYLRHGVTFPNMIGQTDLAFRKRDMKGIENGTHF